MPFEEPVEDMPAEAGGAAVGEGIVEVAGDTVHLFACKVPALADQEPPPSVQAFRCPLLLLTFQTLRTGFQHM